MIRILLKSTTIVILMMLALAQGCTDHLTPGRIQLTTLPFEVQNGQFTFAVQVDEPGDLPVKEYGVVYTAYFRGAGSPNLDPTVDDNRIRFNLPMVTGLNKFDFGANFFNGRTFFYYRAFAITDDNTVVYGNRLTFTLP